MKFIENESARKLRGGYYTPLDLATFIAKWVKEIAPGKILEPSCGDGVFFTAFSNLGGCAQSQMLGFELEEEEAAKAMSRAQQGGLRDANIRAEDFLMWAIENFDDPTVTFDAVVGNPPFVRYQYLPEQFQLRAKHIFDSLHLPFTKHTNAWVPFVLASMKLLRPGGRLAMVLPAEIIHVTHARSLRRYLGQECRRLTIIDPEELWFSDTLQGAVIVLAEKKHNPADPSTGVGIYPVADRQFLNLDPAEVFNAPVPANGKTIEGKWTRALLDPHVRALFDEVEHHGAVHRFKDVAQVDVGIVTGANKFFLVSDEVVNQYQLGKWAHPMFGRSEHCPGIIYDEQQHEANASKGNPTNFLWFNEKLGTIDAAAQDYIALGEEQSLHTRYKCRIRNPWYTVPSVYATEIGMLKRSHNTPRLILNRIGAYTTDTAYRIQTAKVEAEKLVGCFVNPITALSAEIEGRHYGGGVLELVPSEIEQLLIPLPPGIEVDLKSLDSAIRSMPTDDVLKQQGEVILGAMGLSTADQQSFLDGWSKLRDRRQRIPTDAVAAE